MSRKGSKFAHDDLDGYDCYDDNDDFDDYDDYSNEYEEDEVKPSSTTFKPAPPPPPPAETNFPSPVMPVVIKGFQALHVVCHLKADPSTATFKTTKFTLDELDSDCLMNIFHFSLPRDLSSLSKTCKTLELLLRVPALWCMGGGATLPAVLEQEVLKRNTNCLPDGLDRFSTESDLFRRFAVQSDVLSSKKHSPPVAFKLKSYRASLGAYPDCVQILSDQKIFSLSWQNDGRNIGLGSGAGATSKRIGPASLVLSGINNDARNDAKYDPGYTLYKSCYSERFQAAFVMARQDQKSGIKLSMVKMKGRRQQAWKSDTEFQFQKNTEKNIVINVKGESVYVGNYSSYADVGFGRSQITKHSALHGSLEWSTECPNCVAWELHDKNNILALCKHPSQGHSIKIYDVRASPTETHNFHKVKWEAQTEINAFTSAVKLWSGTLTTARDYEKNPEFFHISNRACSLCACHGDPSIIFSQGKNQLVA